MRGCVERRGLEWRQMEKDYNVLQSLIDGAQRKDILRCRGEKMEADINTDSDAQRKKDTQVMRL